MAPAKEAIQPEHTAVRVALWRALHVLIDPAPHVFKDEWAEKIVNEPSWQNRPDMNPDFSKAMRASIVGRARFIEDLVEEESQKGVEQYVILGAGLDTFAQRHAKDKKPLKVFEVDQPGPQAWKQKRLKEMKAPLPKWLRFVPVDFEAGESWWEQLVQNGFDSEKPAVVVSTGVSMYLSHEANFATLKQTAKLAKGSTFAMTFMLALGLLEAQEKATLELVMKKAQEAGTPFLSLFSPPEMLQLAEEAGFKTAHYVAGRDLYQRYFASRTDGLRAGHAEAFVVAGT